MAAIALNNVSVTFPVHVRSAKALLLNNLRPRRAGGQITVGGNEHHVVVEALSSVSLTLDKGDRMGLLGHNGSGKTTLLRVCAGIYRPSAGEVAIDGRIATIFELTAGMNWEETGRTNIVMVLQCRGFLPVQIASLSPEIVEFTELGPFIDMPIRTYSAGMIARLAFAIATAHEPEVLLIDEVIGAGDAEFIVRARQRLSELVDRSGVLVLASHSNDLIRSICNKAAVFKAGRLEYAGPVDDAIKEYAKLSVTA